MNTIHLTYFPDVGILLDKIKLDWGITRQKSRQLIDHDFKEDDRTFDFNSKGETDPNKIVHQKRDIYTNLYKGDNLFFLNYDRDNLLCELEVHHGFDILTNNIEFTFNDTLDKIARLLNAISKNIIQNEDGELLLPDLKMSISNSEFMGGEGNTVSYFYCAANIEHWGNV